MEAQSSGASNASDVIDAVDNVQALKPSTEREWERETDDEHCQSPEVRVSTITAVGSIGTGVDIDVVARTLCVPTCETEREGMEREIVESDGQGPCFVPVYLEYTPKKNDVVPQGVPIRRGNRTGTRPFRGDGPHGTDRPAPQRKKQQHRQFDNQVTLVLQASAHEARHEWRHSLLNMKIFRNGHVQITGAKSIALARNAVRDLSRILSATRRASMREQGRGETAAAAAIVQDPAALRLESFRVCLMNSDTRLPYLVRCALLYRAITGHERMLCSYEPCTYPGVKIRFFCDAQGRCFNVSPHPPSTSPTSSQKIHTDVVCIRCAVFRSGCVLLTGAYTYRQLWASHAYIRCVLDKHAATVAACPLSSAPTVRNRNYKQVSCVPVSNPNEQNKQPM